MPSLATCVASQAVVLGEVKIAGSQPFSVEQNTSESQHIVNALLDQLTSLNEAERFRALDKAKKEINKIAVKRIDNCLTSLRPKNVSTLIFLLMDMKNDALYKVSSAARMSVENSQGSFPNIAYYYARVQPQTGISELYRLYGIKPDQILAISKAIGEVGTPEAMKFLLTAARSQKKQGKDIYPILAGLKYSHNSVKEEEVFWLLEQELNREELISLSHLKVEFAQKDLIKLYREGGRKKKYAVEYIFRDPVANFESLKWIVDREIENKNYELVLQWMMSDNVQKSNNQQVISYKERVIKKIRK